MRRYRLNMTGLALVLGCLVAVLGFAATPALADLFIYFDLSNATLNYTAADQKMAVTQSGLSTLDVQLLDTDGGPPLAAARVANDGGPWNPNWVNDFNFQLSMDLVKNSANWSATGMLSFTDKNMASNAVEASFTSTLIQTYGGGGGELQIRGVLDRPAGRDSILVNRPLGGPTWTYVGELGNVSIPGQLDYFEEGVVLVVKFGVPETNLDTLFEADRTLESGQVKGTIIPAPAAIGLGMLGLGLIGWYMRRFA